MAEEVEEKQGSPIVRYVIAGGLILMVPTTLALLVFFFILRPVLMGGPEPVQEEVDNLIPEEAAAYTFPESQGAVIPDDPDSPAPILLYEITVICDSVETANYIGGDPTTTAYFRAMLDKLHRNRTRSELNDPQVQTTILRRAEQEANNILKRRAPESGMRVLEALYTKFGLVDL